MPLSTSHSIGAIIATGKYQLSISALASLVNTSSSQPKYLAAPNGHTALEVKGWSYAVYGHDTSRYRAATQARKLVIAVSEKE